MNQWNHTNNVTQAFRRPQVVARPQASTGGFTRVGRLIRAASFSLRASVRVVGRSGGQGEAQPFTSLNQCC